jgi:hypothetical protein
MDQQLSDAGYQSKNEGELTIRDIMQRAKRQRELKES